ncbi:MULTISPECIES: hypothetical protein [Pseudomonas]|uniref:hypothetical protein n=1 Tax=Pseudomonas TaxID=286 RepID=UPI001182B7AF|nr:MULTISPECIES: hypothetical protein [Pseudomonas]EKT4464417.1 hypothetical protein [Pseudomonas putida]MCX9139879.1 hypothetical protein [Pseudomonas sp. DCB_PUT]MDD1974097.1 hypothetical protein [Pseudomonas putida]MDO1466036.1 hypothetical protein [Pseudomonas putida]MDO1471406.1 hypothetical protein [Pseudomonas putida]
MAQAWGIDRVLAPTNAFCTSLPTLHCWCSSFLVLTFFTEYAFTLALELTSSLTLVPYLLVAAYALKLARARETYVLARGNRAKDMVIAVLATAYALLMLYAGGLKYLLLSAVIYAPGTLLSSIARRK